MRAVAILFALMAASSLGFLAASSLSGSGAATPIEPAPAPSSTVVTTPTTIAVGGPVSVPEGPRTTLRR